MAVMALLALAALNGFATRSALSQAPEGESGQGTEAPANEEESPPEEKDASAHEAEASRAWALAIAIAVAIGIPCLGAGYAVGRVGAAALGAASEKPELLARSLLFVALAEGIAIYGLLIAVLLWIKLPS
jgi:V/A-type H+-transporting ATPase subunit K